MARYEELQRENMVKVVAAARLELSQLWDKCYVSKEERDKFSPYTSGKCVTSSPPTPVVSV